MKAIWKVARVRPPDAGGLAELPFGTPVEIEAEVEISRA